MLNTKKPSERIDDYFYPRTRLEMTDVENIFLDILDEQHQAIQDLEARVEELKVQNYDKCSHCVERKPPLPVHKMRKV